MFRRSIRSSCQRALWVVVLGATLVFPTHSSASPLESDLIMAEISAPCRSIGTTRTIRGNVQVCRRVGARLQWVRFVRNEIPGASLNQVVGTTTIPPTAVPAVMACATGGPCKVGDLGAAGGIVFYVATTPQPWGRYLEAAPVGWNRLTSDHPSYEWGCRGVAISASRVEVGAGFANTQAIMQACPQRPIAASVAFDLVFGGYDDWFLPSVGELDALYRQASIVGGVLLSTSNQWYYSSTSPSPELANAQMFTTDQSNPAWYAGRIDVWPRYLPWRGLVRPIRYGR